MRCQITAMAMAILSLSVSQSFAQESVPSPNYSAANECNAGPAFMHPYQRHPFSQNRDNRPMQQRQMPEWITEQRQKREEMRQNQMKLWQERAAQPRPERPEMPQWVKERRESIQDLPDWVQERRESFEELPDWVKQQRQQRRQPQFMPRFPGHRNQPMPGFDRQERPMQPPRHAAPHHWGNRPFNHAPWGNPGYGWGPFNHNGLGDLFSDFEFNVNFGTGLNGYGLNRLYGQRAPWGYMPPPPPPQMPPMETAEPTPEPAPAPIPAPVEEPEEDLDLDKDGVMNLGDLCPDTLAGAQVDAFGCEENAAIVLRGVNFKTDSDELTDDSISILDRVAGTLVENPDLRVEVAGHTDSDGDDAYNKDLSQRRSETVMSYLTDKGVNSENMTAQGYGEEQPVAGNDTAEGKALNRRVELKRI